MHAMCERVALPGGGVAIVCGGHRRRRTRCSHCREWAEYECDTCDVPLCRRCRIHVPPDQDYCGAHLADARAAAARLRASRRS
jgi:hypothetical protein